MLYKLLVKNSLTIRMIGKNVGEKFASLFFSAFSGVQIKHNTMNRLIGVGLPAPPRFREIGATWTSAPIPIRDILIPVVVILFKIWESSFHLLFGAAGHSALALYGYKKA